MSSQKDVAEMQRSELKGEMTSNERLAHRIRLFEGMVFLGCLTVSLLNVAHFLGGLHFLVAFQLPLLLINIGNLVLLRYHQKLDLAINVMLGTVFLVLIGTAMIGGIANTGGLWLPIFPILAFLLVGKGGGVYWVISYNIAVLSLFIGELTGFDVTPYPVDFVVNVMVSTLVMSLIVYIYENQRQRLVDDLEVERIRAEEANRAKSHFLANMSHEIRTPMNGIIGLTNIMMRDDLSSESRRHAELIQVASEGLMGLIDDILDISKIEAHRIDITYQAVELPKLIEELVGLLKPEADAKGIKLESQLADGIPECVMFDPLRLRQILLNIVGNSIKFTHEGEVSLSVEKTNLRDNPEREVIGGWGGTQLHFTVRDSGIGIPAEKIDSVFEQFSQADNTLSREYGGSGLGLTISRELAEMMGGRLSVESGVGEGSIFHLYLPMIEADSVINKTIDISQLPEQFDLNVLVAEDDHINQFVITRFLHDLGCTVECVNNGEKAVEAANSGKYDLVLMDLHMPLMDGRQATKRIRAAEKSSQRLPIIALTANVISGEREACLEAGMDDFIVKPLQPERLREALAPCQKK
ncbi:MAG: ATP-binding protein [Gammaproteobacteria bacterium]|nr:ATP-binding protein [Gammaproteobacteria bacterium]